MTADTYVQFLDRTSTQPGERHHAVELLQLTPGQRCLDVGCGVGEDARAMSATTGARVVGIDLNPRMAAEARSRSAAGSGVTFLVGDACRLPFPGRTFDAVWTKRTLMHLAGPAVVLAEMARVVRPGGRIVAVEPDLEVVLLDSAMEDVTRRVLDLHAAAYRSPRVGRQLRRLMLEAGLSDVRTAVEPVEIPSLVGLETALRLLSVARAAVGSGVLTPEEAAEWEEDLRSRDEAGRFACHALLFVAHGRVSES